MALLVLTQCADVAKQHDRRGGGPQHVQQSTACLCLCIAMALQLGQGWYVWLRRAWCAHSRTLHCVSVRVPACACMCAGLRVRVPACARACKSAHLARTLFLTHSMPYCACLPRLNLIQSPKSPLWPSMVLMLLCIVMSAVLCQQPSAAVSSRHFSLLTSKLRTRVMALSVHNNVLVKDIRRCCIAVRKGKPGGDRIDGYNALVF